MNDDLKKTAIKRIIIVSPIVFGLSIFSALKLVEFIGLNLSKTELIFGTVVGIVGCCGAVYMGVRKHFSSSGGNPPLN